MQPEEEVPLPASGEPLETAKGLQKAAVQHGQPVWRSRPVPAPGQSSRQPGRVSVRGV